MMRSSRFQDIAGHFEREVWRLLGVHMCIYLGRM